MNTADAALAANNTIRVSIRGEYRQPDGTWERMSTKDERWIAFSASFAPGHLALNRDDLRLTLYAEIDHVLSDMEDATR